MANVPATIESRRCLMTRADVRDRLTRALRLDLIGPEPDQPQIDEILDRAPPTPRNGLQPRPNPADQTPGEQHLDLPC